MSRRSITGMLFLRDRANDNETQDANMPKDKKLVMVVGIIAVPKEVEVKYEHQYLVVGHSSGKDIELNLLGGAFAIDQTERAKSLTADSLLWAPIWRV